MGRTLLVCWLLSLCVVWPAHAEEQPDPPALNDSDRARDLFRQGAALARQYRWRDALRAFEEAARLRPHARTSYNVGYCERELERFTRARHWFRDAIRRDDAHQRSELNEDQRRATEAYLSELVRRIARVRVEVSPADARITVDERPLEIDDPEGGRIVAVAGTRSRGPGDAVPGRAFDILVDPGPHEIVLSSADGRRKTIEPVLAEGETRRVRLVLPPAKSAAAGPMPEAPSEAFVAPPGKDQLVAAAVLGGLGGLAAIVGTAFVVKTVVTYSEATDACPNLVLCPSDRAFELSEEARLYGNLATVMLVAAGASGVGATALFLATWWTDDPDEPDATVGVGPGWLQLRARF